MQKMIVPLYFRKASPESGRPASFVLRLLDGENGCLVTRENFDALVSLDDDGRALEITVFDLASEARAADRMKRNNIDSEIWHLKTGEGVLLAFSERKLIEEDGADLCDFRTRSRSTPELFGSWELPKPESEALLQAEVEEDQTVRADAIARTLQDLPPSVLQSVQVAIERLPGAFVGFVAASPDEVRKDYRLDGVGPDRLSDAEIQSALCKASSKSELSDAFSEAIDATVERILEARTDLTGDHEDLDSQISDDGMEP